MNNLIDETHDPDRRSWLASANIEDGDFPIQNLPLCVFEVDGKQARGGIGIGDKVLDLKALASSDLLHGEALDACRTAAQATLNTLMASPPSASRALRKSVSALLSTDSAAEQQVRNCLVPMDAAHFSLPAKIGGYTDFLCSKHHTERNLRLRGSHDGVPPAFFSLPVAYNGRVSSIRPSGKNPTRPWGQFRDANGQVIYAPSRALDFELEMGAFVRHGNQLGEPIRIGDADQHIFGLALFNDWSAKDIQWWEQILGPFLGKSFFTSLSPWIVTMDALAPFRVAHSGPGQDDPPPPSHLVNDLDLAHGMFDIDMTASIRTEQMMRSGSPEKLLTATNLRNLHWTFAQMLAHHTSNGCNLETGDFFGSGTVSGSEISSAACMTELTSAGKHAIKVSETEERTWLQDGDEITFRAKARNKGFVPIGFGECRGIVMPAIDH